MDDTRDSLNQMDIDYHEGDQSTSITYDNSTEVSFSKYETGSSSNHPSTKLGYLFDLNENPEEEYVDDFDSFHVNPEEQQQELNNQNLSGDNQENIVSDIDALSPQNEDYWRKLEFASVDSCHQFYMEYAETQTFGVRRQYARKGKITEIPEYVLFVCCCEGFKKGSMHNPKNQVSNPEDVANITNQVTRSQRGEFRTGCKAQIYFRRNKEKNVYYIDRWDGIHNHPLVKKLDAWMLRCNRGLNKEQQIFAETAKRAGLKLRSSYELMSIQAGGRDVLGFLKQDLKNHLNSKRQKDMKCGEGTKLWEHFRERGFISPSFYYDVEVDRDERIANIFWADERMRIDYDYFGDVVTFDTTFRTNKAYRPLGVFIGFNHHRETCIFGAALLYDETAELFTWLFKTFLRCMKQKHPLTIFTDQDAAMAVAIPRVFTNTYHGLCTWHLMQNGMKNLGVKYNKSFSQKLRKMMYDVETEEDFEIMWKETVRSSFPNAGGSDGHWWMKRIYQKRLQWCWPWMRMQFTAGIRSTQLVESFNATIKGFLQSDLHIDEFFLHFDRMVQNTRMKETESDFNAVHKLRRNKYVSSILLNDAAKRYSVKIFNILHEQYSLMMSYRAVPVENILVGSNKRFKVFKNTDGKQDDVRDVIIDTNEVVLQCSCRLFDYFGVLCCHILRVMDVVATTCCDDFMKIPEKYILRRWTVNAKDGAQYSGTGMNIDGNAMDRDPHQIMVLKLLKLAGQACSRSDYHDKIAPEVDRLCEMMEDLITNENNLSATPAHSGVTNQPTRCPTLLTREKPSTTRRRHKSAIELRQQDAKKKAKKSSFK